ncbi:hypothetical protein SAMN05421821_102132 [Mucilaginibacter lappiensis]|uniref:Uncharacterized protein n=1 Tax=Mucilaginibacter lappiensis TaxID=354630 RepID=A0ABR6PFV0_9SPHI|nr:hypothetical protein [Mucilaginibacter lappiensis]SIQ30094.1 hypothetical protein SAMN05421821_102132 [Mucilaginibacter lappiensis]
MEKQNRKTRNNKLGSTDGNLLSTGIEFRSGLPGYYDNNANTLSFCNKKIT